MPDHDLQLGVSVEHSAEIHANKVNTHLDVPAPGRLEHRATLMVGVVAEAAPADAA
jgi:hypothetical protein